VKIAVSREHCAGKMSSTTSIVFDGEISYQEASAFLTAAITAIESRTTEQDPQFSLPGKKSDNGFLHEGQSGVLK